MDLAYSPLPMVISVILCSLIHCPWEDWYVLIWAFGSNARFKNNLLGNVELSWKSGFVPRHHFLVLFAWLVLKPIQQLCQALSRTRSSVRVLVILLSSYKPIRQPLYLVSSELPLYLFLILLTLLFIFKTHFKSHFLYFLCPSSWVLLSNLVIWKHYISFQYNILHA